MAVSRLWMQRWPRVLTVGMRIIHSDAGDQEFFTKNKQLKRPLSPHISIYQPQLTWTMSIAHRAAGVFLTAELSAISLTYLLAGRQFSELVDGIQSIALHPAIITTDKFIIAYAFTYHAFNGIRHLAWDTGRGFQLPTLYRSGYVVLALSLISALGLALYHP